DLRVHGDRPAAARARARRAVLVLLCSGSGRLGPCAEPAGRGRGGGAGVRGRADGVFGRSAGGQSTAQRGAAGADAADRCGSGRKPTGARGAAGRDPQHGGAELATDEAGGAEVKSSSPSANVVGNFEDKYASQNPSGRRRVAGFIDAVTGLYALADPAGKKVLAVGCGEGKLASALIRRGPTPARYLATDVSRDAITTELDPRIETATASIYELPFASASFDVVVCCEVLEHLDEPARGLAEIARVARERVLISTPWEPVWR